MKTSYRMEQAEDFPIIFEKTIGPGERERAVSKRYFIIRPNRLYQVYVDTAVANQNLCRSHLADFHSESAAIHFIHKNAK